MERLDDGTPCYAPVGRLLEDGDRVCCHLCGSWFLSVASHLRVHGWTKADYVTAFGLELGNPLSGEATRKRRSAALTARLAVEPTLRDALAAARTRSRTGELTAAAASAARGRPHPAQRRAKTLATLAGISAEARASGARRYAQDRLRDLAWQVAHRFGFEDFEAYAAARLLDGHSLAAISREAGQHKDWLSRHLAVLAPSVQPTTVRPHASDMRLRPVASRHGFADPAAYLRARHVAEHRSVAAIAAETGATRSTILAALPHHGINPVPHATKRHHAADRNRAVARAIGFDSLAAYVADGRAKGQTWKHLAAESGLPETTLRRHSRR
jgi:lambda repressor-like predicted transcriptional regulator